MHWESGGAATEAPAVPPVRYGLAPARAQDPLDSLPFHTWDSAAPDSAVQFYRLEAGQYLVRFPGAADFDIAVGSSVTCHPVPGAPPDVLQHLWCNQVMPLVTAPARGMTLHASAVQVGQACVAFLGASGRGKSTLAASFSSNGHAFLCDDGLTVLHSGSGWLAQPAASGIRLNTDSLQAVLGDALASSTARVTRKHVVGQELLAHSTQALPLACLYVLGDAGNHELTRATHAAALIEVVRHTFVLDPDEASLNCMRFERSARLVGDVPVWHLDYPRSFDELPHVRRRVMDHASNVATETLATALRARRHAG